MLLNHAKEKVVSLHKLDFAEDKHVARSLTTSGGKTRSYTFFQRSFGFLAWRDVISTSTVGGEPILTDFK